MKSEEGQSNSRAATLDTSQHDLRRCMKSCHIISRTPEFLRVVVHGARGIEPLEPNSIPGLSYWRPRELPNLTLVEWVIVAGNANDSHRTKR
jgi:hypothetical protein